jgi:Xaa-Pro aminopeptidase
MKPDFAARQKKLRKLMKSNGFDAVLATSRENAMYYTGYESPKDEKPFMIAPSDGRPILVLSPLLNEAETKYGKVVFMETKKDFFREIKPFRTLGYNEKSLSVSLFREISKPGMRMRPVGLMIENLRIVKDQYEISQIRNAVRITGKVLERAGNSAFGKTERKIANEIVIGYLEYGVAEAYESIVSSGKQSYFVHHTPNGRAVARSDAVLIDTGCAFNGYCSDITRMFFKRLDAKRRKVYEDAKHIFEEMKDAMKPGRKISDLEKLQNKLFAKGGYTVFHKFGHSIGLSVHEPDGDVLKEGMVMAIEPGIYIKNFGGFRIEDMILIKRGRAETLSGFIPVL